MRRARYLTIVDFFDAAPRQGRCTACWPQAAQLMTYFVWTGAQAWWPPGRRLRSPRSLNVPESSAGMVLVANWVTGYTMLGGMLADAPLDFIQMFSVAGGVTLIFFFVLNASGRLGRADH